MFYGVVGASRMHHRRGVPSRHAVSCAWATSPERGKARVRGTVDLVTRQPGAARSPAVGCSTWQDLGKTVKCLAERRKPLLEAFSLGGGPWNLGGEGASSQRSSRTAHCVRRGVAGATPMLMACSKIQRGYARDSRAAPDSQSDPYIAVVLLRPWPRRERGRGGAAALVRAQC